MPALYDSTVIHKRLQPFTHRLQYQVCYLFAELNELPKLQSWAFGHERFGLFSFYARDHGARDGSCLRTFITKLLAQKNVQLGADAKIFIFCLPRLLGYVFNPITLYFCYHENGTLAAMVYEVKNTFGEQHCYVAPIVPHDWLGSNHRVLTQSTAKKFHVSPFMDVNGYYDFRLTMPESDFSFLITLFREVENKPQKTLIASLIARRRNFTKFELLKTALGFPFMTLKVVAGIHWEALKLWLKGARYHPKPPPPTISS